MPLCALIAVVLLTFRRYDSIEVNTVAMYQGMVVLPFVFLTSLVLLFAILILADHERLEQANRLAGLREVYYQGLRQQETQVRRLRHDLRNHLTAVRGFLEQGDEQGAIGYLDQIAGSPALRGTRRLCENEAANAVLTAKAEAMEREGVAADFAVSLPRDLPVADMDLCALLGNALDNAIEGSRGAGERRITIRCKADKGLFMLRVENTLGGAVQPDLATTKTDKSAHGFGIPGMREIAERYGGTLDAGVRDNGFELVVCLPQTQERARFSISAVYLHRKTGRPSNGRSPCSAAKADSKHLQKFDLFPGGASEEPVLQPAEGVGHHALLCGLEGVHAGGAEIRGGLVHIVHIDGEMRDAARTLRHRGGDQLHQEAAELHKGQLPLLFRRAGGGPEMQAAADLLVKGDAGIHIRRIHGNVAETLIVLFHTISPPVCEK